MPFLSLHLIEDFGIAHVLLMVCRVHLVPKIVLNNDFLYKMKTSFYVEKKKHVCVIYLKLKKQNQKKFVLFI